MIGPPKTFLLLILLLQAILSIEAKCYHLRRPGDCAIAPSTAYSSEEEHSEHSFQSDQKSSFTSHYHHESSSGNEESYSYSQNASESSFTYSSYQRSNSTDTIIVEYGVLYDNTKIDSTEDLAMGSESSESLDEAVVHMREDYGTYDGVMSSPIVAPPVMEHSPSPETKTVEPPLHFYPCGYRKPVDPFNTDTATAEPEYYGEPCPGQQTNTITKPVISVVPIPSVQMPSPQPPVIVVPPPEPVNPTKDSHATAKQVKGFIDAGDVKALSEFVIKSDDIYGLNMGLRFTDEEREQELTKSANRDEDKDVIALKALAQAALDPETKGKVIQLMVLAATAPDGYHFNQHRSLVEQFTVIFADDKLLAEVVGADPYTHLKRRLLCAGCVPVNTYICAYCWPSQICNTYFWCSPKEESNSIDSPPPTASDPDVTATAVKTEAQQSKPVAAPVARSSSSTTKKTSVEGTAQSDQGESAKSSPKRKTKPQMHRNKRRSRRRKSRKAMQRKPKVHITANYRMNNKASRRRDQAL